MTHPSQYTEPAPFFPNQAYQENTCYQILLVEPSKKKGTHKNINTTIVVKNRGAFSKYELDSETKTNLKGYPSYGDKEKLGSYLPSPGVIFTDDFLNSFTDHGKESQEIIHEISSAISNQSTDIKTSDKNIKKIVKAVIGAISSNTGLSQYKNDLGNFYNPIRFLLHSRKISQLIAKTWWSYLEAEIGNNTLWNKFTEGKWYQDEEKSILDIPSEVLDGLIAREIFLHGGNDSPDNPDPEEPEIYSPLKPPEDPEEVLKFLILPDSKAWQGICLSLLLAGQAYYKIGDEYHQISPSILSTGEIVWQYALEVDWSAFCADIKETIISREKPWIAYHVAMPYPPIPGHAKKEEIKNWADAEEEPGDKNDFPFYKKDKKSGKYLIDVDYFRPPYPYIPMTST
ncbi:MAG: hypothetical protein F6J86_15160 [Symploca sp. SIO1B1]|nr:hypothetical protein [Symploca sp. SIO1B1]